MGLLKDPSDVGLDPVDVRCNSAIDAWIPFSGATLAPGDDPALDLGWSASHRATRVKLEKMISKGHNVLKP